MGEMKWTIKKYDICFLLALSLTVIGCIGHNIRALYGWNIFFQNVCLSAGDTANLLYWDWMEEKRDTGYRISQNQ